MQDYKAAYDIEAGEELSVTIRLLSNGEEQSGTFTAKTGQAKTTPAGHEGSITAVNKDGREFVFDLYTMELQRDNEDAIAGVKMQGEKVAEVVEMEVED